MATIRLSDAVVPEVYQSYSYLNSPEKTEFFRAGLIASNPLMNAIARAGGKNSILPFWGDIDATIEPNYSNDDPADLATPNKIVSGQMNARKSFLNQGFPSMDLVAELTGTDPMQHIRNRFGTYWMRQWQRRLIASVQGIYADNVANDAGDMVVNIGAETGNAAIFNGEAVIRASGTMGDAAGEFRAIAVHSRIRDRMLIANEIVYVKPSENELAIPFYKGLRVIVDDSMPIVSGTGLNALYLSVLFGTGAFGYGTVDGSAFALGEGIPEVPVEVDRTPAAGNGGGMETIWERKTVILHPQGFSWDDREGEAEALVEFSPTLADLRVAAHWNRVVPRKNAPFAFLVSKA